MSNKRTAQHLVFDADDTLWECNLYFEQAIADFYDRIAHLNPDRNEVRDILDTFERKNGYGARAFAASLVETVRQIDPGATDETVAGIESLGLQLLEMELAPIDGVAETLAALRPHHGLYLFTKGEEEEQRLKIDRAPIAAIFDLHIVTTDKTVSTYEDVVDSLGLEPERTWMIGNSLRSDIEPALRAGIGAAFVPNPHTWHMEHLDIEHHPDWEHRFLDLERFSDLLQHFAHDQDF